MAVVTRCCWCGDRLIPMRILRADVWACGRDECFQRQWAHAITAQHKKDGTKTGLSAEKLIYLPLPRQVELYEAVDRGVRRILFGGALGGGKSASIRWLHYRQALKYPNFTSIILRRKFPELEKTHILAAQREVPALGGEYFTTHKYIKWHNGSMTQFGHCQSPDDVTNYLSSEFDLVSFDELTTFDRDMVAMISSRARTTKDGIVPQIVSGTNPGGPQSAWVRELYIDKNVDQRDYPDYDPALYHFIPSKLEDNPYLDKGYEATLAELHPTIRKAYREGSWDIWPGQFFTEFDRARHVSEWRGWSPEGLRVACGIDWGYVRPGCCLWVAMSGDGHAYVFDEFVFKQSIAADVATEIRRRSREWRIKPFYVADNQMWSGQDQTGESMAETFVRMGVAVTQATKDRLNGWQRIRAWLRDAPDGKPWLQIHPRCAALIRTLPQLQQDGNSPEDVDTESEDHYADSLRYWAMSRPAPGHASASRRFAAGSIGWLLQRDGARQKRGLLTQRGR